MKRAMTPCKYISEEKIRHNTSNAGVLFLLSCLSYHIWIHELLPKSVTYKELRAYARKFTLGIVYLLKVTRVKGKREGWKKKVEIDTGHARGREKV